MLLITGFPIKSFELTWHQAKIIKYRVIFMITDKVLIEILKKGLHELHLNMTDHALQKLVAFFHLLEKWNRTYNLTAITDLKEMVIQHGLDSLAVAPYIKGQRILDVGTGAGFPGIPLALCYPEKHFVLLDSNGKKVRFLVQAKIELQITNIEPVQSRAETFHTESCFDVIISRAVGTARELVEQTQHLCCPKGEFLLMKGTYPEAEMAELKNPVEVYPIIVPDLQAKRHLMVVKHD